MTLQVAHFAQITIRTINVEIIHNWWNVYDVTDEGIFMIELSSSQNSLINEIKVDVILCIHSPLENWSFLQTFQLK